MFKVLVPLWIDGLGMFAEGSEQAFVGVDPALVAHMVACSQIVPLSDWSPPVAVEAVAPPPPESHPHHVGAGRPAPDTWEAIWGKSKKSEE